jgi:hypothetical protein
MYKLYFGHSPYDSVWKIQILNFKKWQLDASLQTLNDVKSKSDEYQTLFRPLYHMRKWLQYLVQIWQTPHIVSWTMWVIIGLMTDLHYHFLKSKNDLHKVCRAWRVIKLRYSSLLQLKIISGFKSSLKLSLLKTIQILNSQTWYHEKDQTQHIIFIEDDFTKF